MMVQIQDYESLEELTLKIEYIQEQIRFNRSVIKRLEQRNTTLKYQIMGIEEDMKTFREEADV